MKNELTKFENAEQAMAYAHMRNRGRDERERILVELAERQVPLHIYLAAQTAHEHALNAEKDIALQRMIEGHVPVPIVPPIAETPEQAFNRAVKRRNRIFLAILLPIIVYLAGALIRDAFTGKAEKVMTVILIVSPIAIATRYMFLPAKIAWPKKEEIW